MYINKNTCSDISLMYHREQLLVCCGMVVLALMIGACSDKLRRPGMASSDPLPKSEYPQVAALEGLDDYVTISDAIVDKGPPLDVTVVLRSLAKKQSMDVQYRFFFIDWVGRPLEIEPDWRAIRLTARTQSFVRGNALDSNASDWRLEIRPAR